LLSAIGTLQAAYRDNYVWPLKHLNEPVKEALIIVRPGLEVFFEDTLRVAHCLKRHLLVDHQRSPSRYNLDALNNLTENNWFLRLHPNASHEDSNGLRSGRPSAVRIVCMGQENGDTQGGKQRGDDLGHFRRPPRVAMPRTALFKNSQ
jgi:hypothetical protein